jgi:hypothetical protein
MKPQNNENWIAKNNLYVWNIYIWFFGLYCWCSGYLYAGASFIPFLWIFRRIEKVQKRIEKEKKVVITLKSMSKEVSYKQSVISNSDDDSDKKNGFVRHRQTTA